MLRLMGLFKAFRGTDLTPDEEQAIKSLQATLPDGWRFKELRHQLVGRRPVKHETYGAVVKGPDRTVVDRPRRRHGGAGGRLGRPRACSDFTPVGAATDPAQQP